MRMWSTTSMPTNRCYRLSLLLPGLAFELNPSVYWKPH
jgi:hypothetical protein